MVLRFSIVLEVICDFFSFIRQEIQGVLVQGYACIFHDFLFNTYESTYVWSKSDQIIMIKIQ